MEAAAEPNQLSDAITLNLKDEPISKSKMKSSKQEEENPFQSKNEITRTFYTKNT